MEKKFKEVTLAYAMDPENAELNFDLAYEYHSLGHTASAFSHYLRCAERAEKDELAYEALCRAYYCFIAQKRRDFTAKSLLKQAQIILPKRPEAYYLLGIYHMNRKEYSEAHVQFSLALEFCDFDCAPLKTFIGYKGKENLLYKKSKTAWQWDKNEETREILRHLISEDVWETLDEEDQKDIQTDIRSFGLNNENKIRSYTEYNIEQHNNLRFKFPGSKKIKRNRSQCLQDMFVLYMHSGKKKGTYFEIGAGPSHYGSNTALLEEEYGWTGVGVDFNVNYVKQHQQNRKNNVLFSDALKLNYSSILDRDFDTKEIDYLQLDIEPTENTFECLLSIPFEDYKFGVITYEHDDYIDFSRTYKKKSRRYLQSFGYELVIADVSPDGKSSFEDWWVHPDLINRDVIDKIKNTQGIVDIKKHMLGE